MLVERIAELVNTKVITDITAVRDESDENTRVVIELKREAIPQIVVNNLYQHTALETTFSVNMLAIDHGRPKLLSIKDALTAFIEHRREVVLRRTRYELRAAEERAEVLDGFLVALANMDDFIRIIRESANRDEARVKLLALEWNERQIAGFGIEMRDPRRLTKAATNSASGRPTRSWTCASTSSPAWSATRSIGRVYRVDGHDPRPDGHPGARIPRAGRSSRRRCRRSRPSTPRRA